MQPFLRSTRASMTSWPTISCRWNKGLMSSSSTCSQGRYCNSDLAADFCFIAVCFNANALSRDELFLTAFFAAALFAFVGFLFFIRSKPLVCTTVYQNRLTGYVRSSLGCEPDNCVRHFARLSYPL